MSAEQGRKTQNSGIVMSAKIASFSSARDNSPIHSDVTYYGVLDEIVELNYYGEKKFLLFKCKWVDVNGGVKEDGDLTLINFNHKLRTSEPFVLANQVEQVWYVKDPQESGWHIVRQTKPRDYFDMNEDFSDADEGLEIVQQVDLHASNYDNDIDVEDEHNVTWCRDDIEGIEIVT